MAASITFDICDVNNIYNNQYEHFFPKQTLIEWFNGKGFDHKEEYTETEKRNLEEDTRRIYAGSWQKIQKKANGLL